MTALTGDNMRLAVDKLRDRRQYELYPNIAGLSGDVPYIRTYLDALPK